MYRQVMDGYHFTTADKFHREGLKMTSVGGEVSCYTVYLVLVRRKTSLVFFRSLTQNGRRAKGNWWSEKCAWGSENSGTWPPSVWRFPPITPSSYALNNGQYKTVSSSLYGYLCLPFIRILHAILHQPPCMMFYTAKIVWFIMKDLVNFYS